MRTITWSGSCKAVFATILLCGLAYAATPVIAQQPPQQPNVPISA
jgi:hypothetical protein